MDRELWSIGEFAERCGLTPRALRIYDERGLLRPAVVDPATGYRLYASAQLERAVLIAALRQAGIPLSTVGQVVDAPAERAHALLDAWWKRVDAEHRAAARLVAGLHERIERTSTHMTTPAAASGGTAMNDALVALHAGDVAALRRLLEGAPSLATATFEDGTTLLAGACQALTHDHALPPRDAGASHLACVRELLEAGADVNAATREGWTPLHTAAMSGHRMLTALLLDAGADVAAEAWQTSGATPLALSLFYAQEEPAVAIASKGPEPDDLRIASALGNIERVRYWLQDGPPLRPGAGAGYAFFGPPQWFPERTRPLDDQTIMDEALTWAARNGRIEAMEILVSQGADVNANPYRGTPLLWSIYKDCVPAATWLLDRGADPNLVHDFGGANHGKQATALHLAAQYGCMGCLQLLLDRGADPTVTDGAFQSTPLGWARHGEQDEAAALLEGYARGN